MSLIRTVIRLSAVQALTNSTWAQDRVYDSDNTPLVDALMNKGTKPYITVFTDEDVRADISGKDVYAANRRMHLVLELGVASATKLNNGTETLTIPATDAGMELAVDILEGQALRAVLTDPQSQWGQLISDIVLSVYRVNALRGGMAERGGRWASRQLTLFLDTLSDPAPGTVLGPNHPVTRFFTMASAVPAMADAVEFMRASLSGAAAPDWIQSQAWMGLTRRATQAMGIAPVLEQDDTAAVLTQYGPGPGNALGASVVTQLDTDNWYEHGPWDLPFAYDDET